LLRFARNDNIICLLGGGEGLVGGFAANQPPSNSIETPVIASEAKQSQIFTGQH
jgi:hypothetical protein